MLVGRAVPYNFPTDLPQKSTIYNEVTLLPRHSFNHLQTARNNTICLTFCHLEEKGATPNPCSPKIASMRNNKEYSRSYFTDLQTIFLKNSLAAAK